MIQMHLSNHDIISYLASFHRDVFMFTQALHSSCPSYKLDQICKVTVSSLFTHSLPSLSLLLSLSYSLSFPSGKIYTPSGFSPPYYIPLSCFIFPPTLLTCLPSTIGPSAEPKRELFLGCPESITTPAPRLFFFFFLNRRSGDACIP